MITLKPLKTAEIDYHISSRKRMEAYVILHVVKITSK